MSDTPARERSFDARPDGMDFRDNVYEPSLVEVPPVLDLNAYRAHNVAVLDQGTEGACTGFGLATVANFLLMGRTSGSDATETSPRMLYEMARRYDEWPGEDYSGSSARGAVKGWHKHGVCSDGLWPYVAGQDDSDLSPERIANAAMRPLGAYFRVNHKDLVALHAALTEVGVLYATGMVHEGWDRVDRETGLIPPRTPADRVLGGHAFAIVGYDERGFWIQNSWGDDWGHDGFALISYQDWLTSATDTWVARLGAPVVVGGPQESVADFTTDGMPQSYSFADLRPHIVALGNEGLLANEGTYRTTQRDIARIVEQFETTTASWNRRRLVLYAHGGLVPAASAVDQAARMRTQFLSNEIYPIFFVWNTDWFSTLKNLISDAFNRSVAEAPAGGPLDFLEDRTDDLIEGIARATHLAGSGWAEIKENGLLASNGEAGAARLLADALAGLRQGTEFEIHLVGHSAGGILHAALARYLGGDDGVGLGVPVKSCTLWAPASTVSLFEQTYLATLEANQLDSLTLFALRDRDERDDAAGPYRKSILYLVSNALEDLKRIPFVRRDGEPILGMEKFITSSQTIGTQITAGKIDAIYCPTGRDGVAANQRSQADSHVAFSSDADTLRATIQRIRGDEQSVRSPIPEVATAAFEAGLGGGDDTP